MCVRACVRVCMCGYACNLPRTKGCCSIRMVTLVGRRKLGLEQISCFVRNVLVCKHSCYQSNGGIRRLYYYNHESHIELISIHFKTTTIKHQNAVLRELQHARLLAATTTTKDY